MIFFGSELLAKYQICNKNSRKFISLRLQKTIKFTHHEKINFSYRMWYSAFGRML